LNISKSALYSTGTLQKSSLIFVGFEVFTAVVLKSILFWDMTPCSALLNYSTTLKMEAIRSSETSGTTQRTTQRHIPEEDTLQPYICQHL
jgi:hypothetical protein